MSCIRRQQCNQLFECIIVYNTPVFRICCRRLYQYCQRANVYCAVAGSRFPAARNTTGSAGTGMILKADYRHPTAAFLVFFTTDSTDSPDCLPIPLSISVFYDLVFLFSTF